MGSGPKRFHKNIALEAVIKTVCGEVYQKILKMYQKMYQKMISAELDGFQAENFVIKMQS